MSATLLQRVSAHLALGGLTNGYIVKYFRWTDADSEQPTMLLRAAGTEGALSDFSVQYPDVQLVVIGRPETVVADSERCRAILEWVRENYQIVGGLNIEPLSTMAGPYYLEDGRPWFQLEFRVIVSDH